MTPSIELVSIRVSPDSVAAVIQDDGRGLPGGVCGLIVTATIPLKGAH